MAAALQTHVTGEAQGAAAFGGSPYDQLHIGVAGIQQDVQGKHTALSVLTVG